MTALQERGRAFLEGNALAFEEANELWKALKNADQLSLASWSGCVAAGALLDKLPVGHQARQKLCQQEALLTNKDPDLSATLRYDRAPDILSDGLGDLDDPALDGDGETLGIAGGILKRRWSDLGQTEDLRKAAKFHERGAKGELGKTHIHFAGVRRLGKTQHEEHSASPSVSCELDSGASERI